MPKITDAQAEAIRILYYLCGYSKSGLAREFQVTAGTISKTVQGKIHAGRPVGRNLNGWEPGIIRSRKERLEVYSCVQKAGPVSQRDVEMTCSLSKNPARRYLNALIELGLIQQKEAGIYEVAA